MSEPFILTASDELEAVNAILGTIGESPVNSLDAALVDAQLARTLLHQGSRRIQNLGWTWNTDLAVTLPIDIAGNINLGPDVLRITYASDTNIVQRGTRLYDRSTQSYVFTDPIVADELVRFLPFNELPEAARAYLTTRAGRQFQNRFDGDQVGARIQQSDESAAWAALQNFEAEVAQYNVLKSSALVTRLKGSRP